MRCVFSFSGCWMMLLISISGFAAQENDQSVIRHLELRNIGGGHDSQLPYSPICFSPDSKLLAISLANRPSVLESYGKHSPVCRDLPEESGIAIWKIESLQFVKWIPTTAKQVIRFTPDGKSIAALSKGELLRWDIAIGKCTRLTLISKPTAFHQLRSGFTFLPEGKIAVIDRDGIAIYSDQGVRLDHWKTRSNAFLENIESSADGQQVLADSHLWDLRDSSRKVVIKGNLVHATFRPHTEEIWGNERFGRQPVGLWLPHLDQFRHPLEEGLAYDRTGINGSVQCGICYLSFDHTGKFLATIGQDHAIHIWNANAGKRVATLEPTAAKRRQALSGSIPDISFVTFSPDGRWIVAASNQVVSIWDFESCRKKFQKGQLYHLTRYFAGSEIVENKVTNPPGFHGVIGTKLHIKELQPGTPVAALRHGNDELWYEAVVLGTESYSRRGIVYDVQYAGYSRTERQRVPEYRIRPKLAESINLRVVNSKSNSN